MSSSSSDDIAAYLAHLKQSTALKPKSTRGYSSPTKDSSLSDVLSNSPSKLSPVKKSSLRSPQKISSVPANIQKYQDKYVKKPVKVSGKTLVRRSSVVFSVPDGHAGSQTEQDPTEGATSEDSLMDDVLAKCLEETSISDEPEEFGTPSDGTAEKAKVLSAPSLTKMKSTNDTMGDARTKNPSTTLSAKPNIERKLGKGRLLQDSSRPKSAENYTIVKHKTSDGRSLSFENSDLKSVPEEDLGDDRTLSTTPDRSHKSPLLKQTRNVFRSSAIKDDDSTSTSSSSQQYLSKRISRRNSYIYKEECALVSVASSSETIKTDSVLSESSEILELETDDPISEVTSPVPRKIPSEIEKSKLSQHSLAQRPVKVSDKTKIDGKLSTGSELTSVLVTDSKRANHNRIDASNPTSKPVSIVSPSNEYSSSDFEPSSGTKSSHKSSSNISHKTPSLTRSSNTGSEKSRRISKERRSKPKHENKKKPPSSSSNQTSSVISSNEESSDSSSSEQRRSEKKKKQRHKESKRKHSHRSSRKYSCMNCQRMQELLWGAPRLPWPPYDGSSVFLQHVAASYPVSRDQGLTNVSSNVTMIEDALRQTIILGRQFLLSQRSMYDAYCATVTSSYRYTTMHGIERIIRHSRKAPPTLPEAYKKADKDLLDKMRRK